MQQRLYSLQSLKDLTFWPLTTLDINGGQGEEEKEEEKEEKGWRRKRRKEKGESEDILKTNQIFWV